MSTEAFRASIACFSPSANQFAFQANGSQKNFVDLYPLDPANNYKVNSSLVNPIDYEANDLDVSEIKILRWCITHASDATSKVKRRGGNDAVEEIEGSTEESSLINVFPNGKIVVFSPNGQDIVNIIHNKRDILAVDTIGSSIWLLDDDKTVKHFNCKSTKPLKTFHLTDGKNEVVTSFQTLQLSGILLLALIVEDAIYIIDPSKRRPSTLCKLSIPNCISCKVLDDDHIVVCNSEKIYVVQFRDQTITQEWKFSAERIAVLDGKIVALGSNGGLVLFKLNFPEALCTIRVQKAAIIDYKETHDLNLIIAWLNVNEPKFEIITPEQLSNNSGIILNQSNKTATTTATDTTVPIEPSETNEANKSAIKVTKSEQNELSQSLIDALVNDSDEHTIIDILSSEKWTESRIKDFIRTQLSSEWCNKIFGIVCSQLKHDVWSSNKALLLMLKWLLTLRSSEIDALQTNNDKSIKKTRAALKSCSDTFPILLSIQGALEMLKAQAKLRQDLTHLSLEEEDPKEGENETDIIYENGEAGDFVDALDRI
ncbi:Utp9p Ecym_5160 [Eremothecium cymbalariae DBVPG|uniref:Small-subunit processome Utp12 domain-containing protein n=1 Tax=Eremothecium cymbalariae (strain CBS 270.75 / DBVPG 7215 / KCTC 17166 / NRRL Y-17582) TaxID=931890 RepID=I6NCZ3_ERECY|nr:hypothetical protein Ecym_5160 [Eremothecium cymbalariae DBVPG\